MSLRIAWAGPWNTRSSIALFGLEVCTELARLGHRVEVLRTELGAALLEPPRPAPGPVHAASDLPMAELMGDFDGIIVNLGDHYDFHGGALPLLREAAPLVVLHDAWMGGFVHNWRVAAGASAWQVEAMLGGDLTGIAPFCAMASGAVVHGPHYRSEAAAACPGPVACLPLAFTAPPVPPPEPPRPGARLVVTTVGHVNRNKRADAVIRAIAASDRLRDRVLYVLAGPAEPDEQARLLALARNLGVPEPHFTGWVPDEVLRAVLAGTDVVSCLRFPVMEGGSASLITAMLSGRPTLVSDHASYAEVPDGLVLKCPPGEEAGYVLHHLETILDRPEAARAMGAQAREYALSRFAPAAYAPGLLDALAAATAAQPGVRAARAVGRQLGEFGMAAGDPALRRIAGALAGMLDSGMLRPEAAEG